MGVEIERKFLVVNDDWRGLATGVVYRQGYLCPEPGRTVRVRIAGDAAFLTIKGQTNGISRLEYEYPLPLADAEELLRELCLQPVIDKKRYRIPFQGFVWEVDEFFGENAGLVVAEIELQDAEQEFARPDWVGLEVSGDRRYYNGSLARYPYSAWKDEAAVKPL